MKNFLKQMLSSGDGVSHKRVLGTIGFLALVVTLVVNSFYELNPSPELISAVEYLVISTIFGTVIEKFTNSENKK